MRVRCGQSLYLATEHQECDHGGKRHEGIEEVAEPYGHPQRHHGEDDERGYEKPCVVTCFLLAEEISGAAVAVEAVAEH